MNANQFDQDLANLRDGLPRMWYALYVGCVEAGFSHAEAFALLHSFILSQNPKGIRPDTPAKDKADE